MRIRSMTPTANRSIGAHCIRVFAWMTVCISTLGIGCSTIDWPGWVLGRGGASSDDGVELEFESWKKDSLRCAARLCENIYEISVPDPGRLRIEVYAPLDSGGPDFSLVLLDAENEEIARPIDDEARPRRLAYDAEPGRYWLRVSARGDNRERLRYEVVAFYERQKLSAKPRARKQPAHVERPAPTVEQARKPVPPAPPERVREILVGAEVLDLEIEEDGASFLLLDKGAPDGVQKDMRGGLRDGEEAIGEFVIVEVYEDGSRARVEGDLVRDVGIDTVAEIYR